MSFELPAVGTGLFTESGVPYIGSKDASDFITVAASQWFKNASNLWVPVSAANPLPNTLAGSSIPDSQAVPMTQAQKDIVARAVDAIIDTIGAENIRLFLPMWEASGTKAYDLLRRDLTFTYQGPTLGQAGVFGPCPLFDGVNDYLSQDPVTENVGVGVADYALNGGTKKAATRMVAFAANPGFVRLKLKRTGTLASATVRSVLYTDNSGVPGTIVTNGTSDTLACSAVDTSYGLYGCIFSSTANIQKNQKFWIALEYVNATGVDASNYISWQYETGANTYGERRAAYDGASWTATDTENMVFSLYDNRLAFMDDYSIIACASDTSGSITASGRAIIGAMGIPGISHAILLKAAAGYTNFRATDSGTINGYVYQWLVNTLNVYAQTFTKASSTGKLKGYIDGAPVIASNGAAGVAQAANSLPWVIGSSWNNNGGVNSTYWQGLIGPVIITKNALSDANMAKVSHNLLALRKYGMAA